MTGEATLIESMTIDTPEAADGRGQCFTCGQRIPEGSLQADAVIGGNCHVVVCEECMQSPETLEARAKQHAARLRDYAELLEQLAVVDFTPSPTS